MAWKPNLLGQSKGKNGSNEEKNYFYLNLHSTCNNKPAIMQGLSILEKIPSILIFSFLFHDLGKKESLVILRLWRRLKTFLLMFDIFYVTGQN